jgi:hypothetical protein
MTVTEWNGPQVERIEPPRTVTPRRTSPIFLYGLGALFMVANKIRHSVRGYATPRTFSPRRIEQSVAYSFHVCKEWEKVLSDYTRTERPFYGKDVLEVGPGPDLGNGLILLAKGARTYTAVDMYDLIRQTDERFYDRLLTELRSEPNYLQARVASQAFFSGQMSPLRYGYDPDFRLEDLQENGFDLFVSRATVEHFQDVPAFFQRIKYALRSGGMMASLIDIKTHTRYIRDVDPLNLLRYPDRAYHLLGYSGIPNRWRKRDYFGLLEELGCQEIRALDDEVACETYTQRLKRGVAGRFQDDPDLATLVFWLLARC